MRLLFFYMSAYMIAYIPSTMGMVFGVIFPCECPSGGRG